MTVVVVVVVVSVVILATRGCEKVSGGEKRK